MTGSMFITGVQEKSFNNQQGEIISFISVKALTESGDSINLTADKNVLERIIPMAVNKVTISISSRNGYPKLKIVSVSDTKKV